MWRFTLLNLAFAKSFLEQLRLVVPPCGRAGEIRYSEALSLSEISHANHRLARIGAWRITAVLGVVLALLATVSVEASARADKPTYEPPIIITKGGTYSGNWESLDPDVPAVQIQTSEPVIIRNARIRGRGHLIHGIGHVNLTVRDSYGYGLNPGVADRPPGRFILLGEVDNVVVENNYLEGTAGIYVWSYVGNKKSDAVRILRNQARNIDGRFSDGAGGFKQGRSDSRYVQFVQLDKVRGVPNVKIAWNEVVNEPGKSLVADNINVFLSSGTAVNPIRIHDNYIQGAYPLQPATNNSYSGGGILLGDGSSSTVEGAAAFVKAYHNQVVSTTNYGIAIANGHDNEFYENRIVSSGYLPNGSWTAAQNVGAAIWDYSGDGRRTPSTFYNNSAHDNLIGWAYKNSSGQVSRNDAWFPNCAANLDGSSCKNNRMLPGPVTREVETAEFAYWQDKLTTAKVKVGPRGSSSPVPPK